MKVTWLFHLLFLTANCAPKASTDAPAAIPAGLASAPPSAAVPATPASIAVRAGQQVLLKTRAKGVQVYLCKSSENTPGGYAWTLEAPDAELFDDQGNKIGRHYGGPTWQLQDGSTVVGKLRSKADSPDHTALPWLLLDAESTQRSGVFTNVANIQRVETSGGIPPANGCDAVHDGTETRVDYAATYLMYGPAR
jgi:hypothetical protein